MSKSPSAKLDTVIALLLEATTRLPPNRLGAVTACEAEMRDWKDLLYQPDLRRFLAAIRDEVSTPGPLVLIRKQIESWLARKFPAKR